LKIKGCSGQMTRIERLIRQVNIYGRDKEQKFLWAEKQ
jgi:hypothetical protein